MFFCSVHIVLLVILIKQNDALEVKCSDLSYNWCYIEESINLKIGEELKIINQRTIVPQRVWKHLQNRI